MSKTSCNRPKDIQAAGKVTVDAIVGVTDIVEAMHHTIINLGRVPSKTDPLRTKGITGMVYKNIRSITKIVGKGLDVSLNQLSALIGESDSSPGREAILAVLNGVLGDYLMASENQLAIPMRFRREGKPLTTAEIAEMIQKSDGRIAIMVHGSSTSNF